MGTALLYGYTAPDNGDPGNMWAKWLRDNWERIVTHDHDGVDSAAISTAKTEIDLVAGDWVDMGDGTYRQLVTLVGGLTFNNTFFKFTDYSTEEEFFPTTEKVSANSFYVYVNDNTIDVALYCF